MISGFDRSAYMAQAHVRYDDQCEIRSWLQDHLTLFCEHAVSTNNIVHDAAFVCNQSRV